MHTEFYTYITARVCFFCFTEPAVIAITPLSVSTTAGDTVLLACSARGPVLPTVTWSYEGVPLTCIDRNFCYGKHSKYIQIFSMNLCLHR